MNGLARYDEALAAAEAAGDDTPELFVADVVAQRADRGRRAQRRRRPRGARARPARRARARERDGLGARPRGARAGAAERGRGRGAPLPRGDRAAGRGRACVRSSPARISSTASGCAARAGARTPASSCAPRTSMLAALGMEAFAERARRELVATGGRVRRRSVETRDELTPQEAQIARLARDGLSNPEIGARLFLSPRTVEWHLRKVFAKLGISSRMGLHDALPDADPAAAPA